MTFSHSRGWKIAWNAKKKEWVYEDNGKPIDDRRVCKRCGKPPTKEGHDACLGTIPNVKYACCGHGVTNPYYENMDGYYRQGGKDGK